MKKKADLIVIGKGIGALSFLFELSKLDSAVQNKKIFLISSDHLALPCSNSTTSTVSLSGIEEGISDLGNLLFQSYHYFKNTIYPLFKSEDCIEKVSKKMFIPKEDLNKTKRFNHYTDSHSESLFAKKFLDEHYFHEDQEAFIICPESYHALLLLKIKKNLNIELIDDFILSSELHDSIILHGQKDSYEAKNVFDARGAYQKEFAKFFPDTFSENITQVHNLKLVRGSFLKAKYDFPHSFYYVINELNFIYRKTTHELIIGSSTNEGSNLLGDQSQLSELYLYLDSVLTLKLPEFNDFQIVTGLRSKAKKRTPLLLKLNLDNKQLNYLYMTGLYKNAYTTGLYLAHEYLKKDPIF